MASMVAKSSVSNRFQAAISSVSDKASTNKRKFRADIPHIVSAKLNALIENDMRHIDIAKINSVIDDIHCQLLAEDPSQLLVEEPGQLLAEEPASIPSHCDNCACNVCGDCEPVSLKLELRLPGTAKKDPGLYDPGMTDWDESAESELQELVLRVMDATFKSAIKKIVVCGYSERAATEAVMSPGFCYGSKDTLSNIVDNSLSFLKTSPGFERLQNFKDLGEWEDYVLAEFVSGLQAVRPIFTPAEALWYLLVFDMDVSHACLVVNGQYKLTEDEQINESSPKPLPNQLSTHSKRFDLNLLAPSTDCDSKLPVSLMIPKLKEPEALAVLDRSSRKDEMHFSVKAVDQSHAAAGTSQKLVAERKLCGSRRPHSVGTLKNESSLDKKWQHVDKGWRMRGPKGAHKTGKMLGLSSDGTTFSGRPLPAVNRSAVSNASVVEGYVSSSMKKEPTWESVASHSVANDCNNNGHPSEDIKVGPVSGDRIGEIISQLTTRSESLKNDLKEWTEWANTKVLQATRRLLKHKPELNKLRQEKVEMKKLEQETQALKDNTTKKLSELENAMYNASGKVKAANSAYKRLEVENAALRQELEAAQSQAAKSDNVCQDAFGRERERLTSIQSYVKQKDLFQKELDSEKHMRAQAQEELRQATGILSQLEANWENESKAAEAIVLQAASMREEIERLKASGKTKEEAVNSKAGSILQKYKDDIQELEREISKLRLKSDSSKIAALRRGIGEGMRKSPTQLKFQKSVISKNTQGSHIINVGSFAKRHRECVMCLEEEISVVFLPCAHQVLCVKCNEEHEKKGMKDCPSCRSIIGRRIAVRYAMP
uniref:RING-type domain-containing protein n=1 Tax=Kalanchoe fedtschenkoi TaxID=63787 RepID=A0A7N0UIZ7_KALFE